MADERRALTLTEAQIEVIAEKAATAQFFLFVAGAWASQGPIASQSINSGQFPFAVSSGVTMGWTA